jgi:polar amino acid transport system substrate-binding protein
LLNNRLETLPILLHHLRLISTRSALACYCLLFTLCLVQPGFALQTHQKQVQSITPAANTTRPVLELSPQERQWLAAHPNITVSNEFDWPPFDFVISGKPQGFGIDLMNLIAERSGFSFTYINGYTWDELVRMFFDGQIDVLHSLSPTPERVEKTFFSPPYYHSKNVLILRSDTDETNDLNELEGKIIALPRGWSSIQFLQKNYPGIHIIEVDSSRQALEYVDQGKVFATIEQEGIAAYFMKKFGFHDLKLSKWIENEELQRTSSMHFAVLHDKPLLFSILDKALATIQPDELDNLAQKWFGREGRQIGIEDIGLTPAEKIFLQEKRSITYCVSPENMPFEAIQNDHLTGMLSDFLEIFSEQLNTSFTLVPTTSLAESLAQARNGACDILPMINQTVKRKAFLDFTTPYLTYDIAIITREQEGFIGNLGDLSGRRVAIPAEVFTGDIVSRNYPKINLVLPPSTQQCLLQLSSGQVDAAVLSLPAATFHIRHMGLNDLKVAGYSGMKDIIRIGVQKDNTQLHSIMSKVARSIPVQDIETVNQKWVSLTFEHRLDYSLMWKIIGGIGLVMALVLIWNWQLMRLNKQLASAHDELQFKSKQLKKIAITDSLTGLYNRRYIEEKLEEELRRQRRYNHNLSVILLDIDHFKLINDIHGHQAGDKVLQKFAHLLLTGTRESDIVSRWGGEEFLILCLENDIKGAAILGEHLRQQINETAFSEEITQTASFGIACYISGETKDDLILRADKALYKAKENGRNRIELA